MATVTFTSTMAGASSDYVRYVYNKPVKTSKSQESTILDFALAPIDTSFVKLTRGSYITINSNKYSKWFTGYIVNDPELTYLGKDKNHNPVWGYVYRATADEYILSLKPIGVQKPFLNCYAGDILKKLADYLQPGLFDVTNIDNGPLVAQYTPDPEKKFFDVQKELCDIANYIFYGNDHKLYFKSQDSASAGGFTLDGNNKHFTPSRLTMKPSTTPVVNDVIVLGDIEPQTYVTEYFIGTGLDANFPLMTGVFGTDITTLIDEQFSNSSIDKKVWTVYDQPANYLQVSNGYLNALGGDNTYSTYLSSVSPLPMENKLRLTHGEWDFVSGTGVGVIAGLWTQAPNSSYTGCLYALKFTNGVINPIVGGVLDTSQSLTIDTSKRYIIRTLADFAKTTRTPQGYSYVSQTGVVTSVSAAKLTDTVNWQTVITEVDPTNGTQTNQYTFKSLGTLNGTTDVYASYVPVVTPSLHATVSNITVSIPLNASLYLSTLVDIHNSSFETWTDTTHPYGWSNLLSVYKETTFTNTGNCAKLIANSSGSAYMQQDVHTEIEANKVYTVNARLQKSTGATGTFKIYLTGTGITPEGLSLTVSSGLTTSFANYTATLTAGLTSIPDDLAIKVELTGATPSDSVWIDDINVVSKADQKLVGPNDVDAMDGNAPYATIVSSNNGANTKNSVLGVPQYNPGQDQLVFFKDSVTQSSNIPPSNQLIKLSYRSSGPALGRSMNQSSVNTEATNWGDSGFRTQIQRDVKPRPRTALECELAAAAIVSESCFQHYEGTYNQFSNYFTTEPKGGGVITFTNLSSMVSGLQSEEIDEVKTTLDSANNEIFIHEISFGKPKVIHKLLKAVDIPIGAFQKDSSSTTISNPVDASSVGLSFNEDVVSPSVICWDDNYVYMDVGQDLGSNMYFEIRYTDESWGVDDAKNLLIRSTSRYFTVPRNDRGRTVFIKAVKKSNLLPYSEDQTQGTVYATSGTITLSNTVSVNPENAVALVSGGTASAGAYITGLFTGLGATSHCFSVSVKGNAGNTVTMQIGATLQTFTLSGQWQRFSMPVSGAITGATACVLKFNQATTYQTTRWSIEQGSLTETIYAKTTSNLYGAYSRYSACIRASFPVNTASYTPGDVTIDDISYAYNSDGKLEVKIWYTPPTPIGSFEGVHCYEEPEDQSSTTQIPLDGSVPLDGTGTLGGDWHPEDRGKFAKSPVILTLDPVDKNHTKRFYLASYSTEFENTLVRANAPNPTPSVTLAVVPKDQVSGEEYARLISNPTVTVTDDIDHIAQEKYRLLFTWTAPTDDPRPDQQPFGGVQIVYEYSDGTRKDGPFLTLDKTSAYSDWLDYKVTTSIFKVWFVSADNTTSPRRNSIITGLTPMVSVTVTWPPNDAGSPYAPDVTGFTVSNPRYITDATGNRTLLIDYAWTSPTQSSWGGATIWAYIPGQTNPIKASSRTKVASGTLNPFSNFPQATETWTFRAISENRTGWANSPDPTNPIAGTPTTTLSVSPPSVGGPGQEQTSVVTGLTIGTQTYTTNAQGQKVLNIPVSWTNPSDVTYGGCILYISNPGFPTMPGIVSGTGISAPISSMTIQLTAFPQSNETWTIAAISYSKASVGSGPLNTYYAGVTPTASTTVTPPPSSGSGLEYTSNVTGFAAGTQTYTTNAQGQKTLNIPLSWTNPSDVTFGGVVIWAITPSFGSGVALTGQIANTTTTAQIKLTDFPTSSESWTIYALPFDVNNKSNVYNSSVTPKVTVTVAPPTVGGSGVEYTSSVSAVTPTLTQPATSDGTKRQQLSCTFTAPSDSTWGGVELRVYNATPALVSSSRSATSPVQTTFTDPSTSSTYTWKLVSYDVNNRTNTEQVGTPQGTLSVGSATGTFDLTKYLPTSTDLFTISSGKIVVAAAQIPTTALVDLAVTNAKLAANAVAQTNLQDAIVSTAKLVDAAVSSVKIATGAITTTHITDGSITTPKIVAGAVTTTQIAANTIVAGNIASGTITATEIAAGAITTAKISAGAITATEIAAGAITTAKISAGAVTTNELGANAVTAAKISAGTITTTQIAASTIIGSNIAANTIAGSNIVAGTITSDLLNATEIKVGGGGSKPGKFGVYDGSGVNIAFIGTDGTNYGGWFKTISIGGTSFSSGILKSDSSGNVTITGASITVDANGVTTSLTNGSVTGGYYSGFTTYNTSDLSSMVFIAPGVMQMTNTTTSTIKFYINGSNSVDTSMSLYKNDGTERFRFTTSTGTLKIGNMSGNQVAINGASPEISLTGTYGSIDINTSVSSTAYIQVGDNSSHNCYIYPTYLYYDQAIPYVTAGTLAGYATIWFKNGGGTPTAYKIPIYNA